VAVMLSPDERRAAKPAPASRETQRALLLCKPAQAGSESRPAFAPESWPMYPSDERHRCPHC